MLKGTPDLRRDAQLGFVYGLGAYLWWGVAPLYFNLVTHVHPVVVLAHRVLWSALLSVLIVLVQRRWAEVWRACCSRQLLAKLAVASVLIGINWGVFIYAVTIGQVLQASLGYYINPMISVLLGLLFLRERLRPWQWVAVGLAVVGVGYLTLQGQTFPWISLTLALSFGLYGLVRKKMDVGPVVGLAVETTLLVPLAAAVLMVPWGADQTLSVGTYCLMAMSSVITSVPLLLFTAAVRRLRLATIGFMQYVGPTVQFLVAILILGEHLRPEQLMTFCFIWSAVVIYSVDSLRAHRAVQPVVEMAE